VRVKIFSLKYFLSKWSSFIRKEVKINKRKCNTFFLKKWMKYSAITSPTATDTHALRYLPVNERPSTASANTFYKICFLPTVEMAPLYTLSRRDLVLKTNGIKYFRWCHSRFSHFSSNPNWER